MSFVVETWRALLEPRRALPLALVAAALLSAEWLASGAPLALALDALLLVAFVLVSPATWRALAPAATGGTARLVGAWAAHTAVAAAVVAVLAVLVPPWLGMRSTYVSDPRSLGVLVVLFVVGGWGLGRDIELERSLRFERARAEELAGEAEHAQILALRAQLDPHFLFNTLNAIAEWCVTDPSAAEAATLRLSSMLRGIFDALRAPRWPLERELALLEELGALYAARDGRRYVFEHLERELPGGRASLGDVEVPPLCLLPLFENAIKHGPAAGHAGTVRVVVSADPGTVRIEIENPGPLGSRRPDGHGIASVERRLELEYGTRATLELTGAERSTRALVCLPRAPRSAAVARAS